MIKPMENRHVLWSSAFYCETKEIAREPGHGGTGLCATPQELKQEGGRFKAILDKKARKGL